MQIHRSRHTRGFTVLPNALLQDRQLSYTARGLLADLLSRPDGWSEDGRRMADTSPQGRLTVAKALRELTAAGYYRVERVRRGDGTFVSEAHVYDTPRLRPGLTRPGSGEAAADDRGAHPVKNRGKELTLPAQRSRPADAGSAAGEEGRGKPPMIQPNEVGTTGPADAAVGEAVSTLFRVLRPEPRLRLGTVEAMALAPLVTPWLERGYGQRDLAEALLGGLPARVHSAPAILRDRLTRKLPPGPEPVGPAKPRWSECGGCARPIPHEGVCRSCAGFAREPGRTGDVAARTSVAARGRARVRAALQADSGRLLTARA
ncbi:hypothetical protein [Actinacidiphila sp. ITFR-21]|uniref:hypothetical protein n=1 Tax=Actinacidiphila sp. ITFR-21 TaxID=3075199 RepID=UPI00288A8FA4|nr:hypothetical protein [Streptomyces sp. ITFR-21]WNI16858.1 hypothetical protein RLT57_15910 [Streptomyces sp. ITFR-21]